MARARILRCGVVREAEFTIGRVTLLIGPNGAGKTTILRTLAGITHCNCSLEIDGIDLCRLPPWERGIGYVPQKLALFNHMTVYDNIAYGLRARRLDEKTIDKKVRQLAALVGVEHLLERRAWSLSTGEASRVALARALAINPRLLLIDEALDHIDPGTRAQLLKTLEHASRKETRIILVTHHIADAIAALNPDTITVAHKGRIIYNGPPTPQAIPPNLKPTLGEIKTENNKLYYHSPTGTKTPINNTKRDFTHVI